MKRGKDSKIKTPSDILLDAISPEASLPEDLTNLTSNTKVFFQAINDLDTLSHRDKIIVGSAAGTLLLEFAVLSLRSSYYELVSSNFNTISQIRTSALVSNYTMKKFIDASHRDVLIKYALIHSTDIYKSGQATTDHWFRLERDFATYCDDVNLKVQDYEVMIKELRSHIEGETVEVNDHTAAITVDALAKCVIHTNVGIMIAFGPEKLAEAREKLCPPPFITDVQAKNLFKAVFHKMDIVEKMEVFGRMDDFGKDMKEAATKLTTVKDAFYHASADTKAITKATEQMHRRLVDVSENANRFTQVKLNAKDTDKVAKMWKNTRSACKGWLDEFSRQGIDLVSYLPKLNGEPSESEMSDSNGSYPDIDRRENSDVLLNQNMTVGKELNGTVEVNEFRRRYE